MSAVAERPPALGTLRDRVQLLRRDMTPEPEGGHATVYIPLATVWARVRTLAPGWTQEAGARGAAASHTVVMRFRADLRPGDRVIYRGRKLEILGAEDLNGRRAFLNCRCREAQVAG